MSKEDSEPHREIHLTARTSRQYHGKCVSFVESRRSRMGTLALFRSVFLPSGYPNSVSDDYLQYQFWDTVQAFASSIGGSLATKAVLKGVGVGDETATALGATLTWLLRHGAGMAGQILFAWAQATELDFNCKRWRLFADIMNDAAMCLELSGPIWPKWCFQGVLCTASVARSLVGVAGGATRTAITQHQARSNNISDVAAKDGSQETLVNLLALLVNLVMLPLIADNQAVTWLLFFLLTCLHLFANYQAVKSLNFATLNQQRLLLNIQSFLRIRWVLGIAEANRRESVLLGRGLSEPEVLAGKRIDMGVSFEEAVKAFSDIKDNVGNVSEILRSVSHTLKCNGTFPFLSHDGKRVCVLLQDEAERRGGNIFSDSNVSEDSLKPATSPRDPLLEAYVRACFMAIADSGQGHRYDENEVEEFFEALKTEGWRLDVAHLKTQEWRSTFHDEKIKTA